MNKEDQSVPKRPEIQITHSTGEISIQEVFGGVLYFRRPHLTIRKEVADCIKKFYKMMPEGSFEYFYNNEGEQADISAAILEQEINSRFFSNENYQNAGIKMEGQGLWAPGFFLEYEGMATDRPVFKSMAGTLQLWVPRAFFEAKRELVEGFFADTFAELPFSCGQIGLGLSGENKQKIQAIAARYPGLDIANPQCVCGDIEDKIAGIAWQTLLGQKTVSALGGVSAIESAITEEARIYALSSGGCRIVLGDSPCIGDVNRNDLLPDHRKLAQFFDQHGLLHIPECTVYFVNQEGMADIEAMQIWHRRWL